MIAIRTRAVVRMQVQAEPWKPDPGLGWPDVLVAPVLLRVTRVLRRVTRGAQLRPGTGPANRGPRPTTGVGGLSSETDPSRPSRALAAHVVDHPVRDEGLRRIRQPPGRKRPAAPSRLRLNDLLNGQLAEGERRRTGALVLRALRAEPSAASPGGGPGHRRADVTRSRSVIGQCPGSPAGITPGPVSPAGQA
jgi:hypothetical protein